MIIYIVVFMFDGNIVPMGKIYYDLPEARKQKEKLDMSQFPTIIAMEAGKPPSVVR